MHHYRLILVLSFPLLLAACFPVQKKQDVQPSSAASSALFSSASVMQKSSVSSVSKEAMKKGVYSAYRDGVIGKERAVLFFHAAWCPECRESDAELRDLYEKNPPAISTYKVDYDTAIELKQRYGVVTQHTFVLVAPDGTALQTIIGPSHEKLLSLLR
jgi:thiol-disulfide isomerase/thioredoxin